MARLKRIAGLSEVANRVLGKADRHNRRAGAAAVLAWNEVVGAEISRRTRGFALRDDGELVVFVDGAAWANQLSLMSQELLDGLNDHLGENQVRSLRFTVSRRVRSEEMVTRVPGETEVREVEESASAPLTETERAQAQQVASAIKNTTLREAALRAMIKDLERKKGLRRDRPDTGR